MPTAPRSKVQLDYEWGGKEKDHNHLIIELLVPFQGPILLTA